MSSSFQNEIPKARVNITLDLETGGASKKKELPLKILALGDFTHGKTIGSIANRERINVNKNNFDDLLNNLTPALEILVANKIKNNDSELKIKLQFKQLKDFHPEQIVNQVLELKNLLAMRNLLKDLKANLLDNAGFRHELERIMKNGSARETLNQELKKLSPLES